MANSTFLHTLLGASGSLGEGNSSTSEPYVREFHEKKVQETSTEIHGLQPFTVYRIDLHACNDEIQQCSAPAFAFPRTEPAGEMTVNSVRVCCWENWIKHTLLLLKSCSTITFQSVSKPRNISFMTVCIILDNVFCSASPRQS